MNQQTMIRDENGVLIIEDSIAGVKCDTNRRIYCKNVRKATAYRYIGFDMPQGLSREQKRQHLMALHGALLEYSSQKEEMQQKNNDEADTHE